MGSTSSSITFSGRIHRTYKRQLYHRFHNTSTIGNTKETEICNSNDNNNDNNTTNNDDIADKLGIKLQRYEELEILIRTKEKYDAMNSRSKLNLYDISDKEMHAVLEQLFLSIESYTISTTEYILLSYHPELKKYINKTMICCINDKAVKLTAIMLASACGNCMAIELLLQNSFVDINYSHEDENHYNSLILAVIHGQKQSVETLCQYERLTINHSDCNSYNALHHAVTLDEVEITRIICRRKDIGLLATNQDGDTVLHIACRKGNQQIIDIILKTVSRQTLLSSSLYNGNHLYLVSPRIDDKLSDFSDDLSDLNPTSPLSLDNDSCLSSPRASILARNSLNNIAQLKNNNKETALSILEDTHKFLSKSCSSPTKQQQYKKIIILKEKLKRLN
jgi:hypothetical protein